MELTIENKDCLAKFISLKDVWYYKNHAELLYAEKIPTENGGRVHLYVRFIK